MRSPRRALARWVQSVKPGGHIIITVPDIDLYEKNVWPSRFNGEHFWGFTLDQNRAIRDYIISLPELLKSSCPDAKLIRAELIESTFDEQEKPNVDQTLGRVAECCIEFVVRKSP